METVSNNNALDKVARVRDLYFHTSLTQAQIGSLVGVSQKTISTYISENKWKLLKKRANQAPAIFLEQLDNELQELNGLIALRPEGKRFATIEEAETRRKIMYSMATIKDRQSAGTHAEVIINILTYIARKNLPDAQLFSHYTDEFMKEEMNMPNAPKFRSFTLAGEYQSLQPSSDEG